MFEMRIWTRLFLYQRFNKWRFPYGRKQLHRGFFRSVGIHLGLSFMALCQHVSGLLADSSRTGSILFWSVIVTQGLRLLTVHGWRVSLWLVLTWLIFPWKVTLGRWLWLPTWSCTTVGGSAIARSYASCKSGLLVPAGILPYEVPQLLWQENQTWWVSPSHQSRRCHLVVQPWQCRCH